MDYNIITTKRAKNEPRGKKYIDVDDKNNFRKEIKTLNLQVIYISNPLLKRRRTYLIDILHIRISAGSIL